MSEPLVNRLADALSPYLLQHADNPVAWQEWGDEAFALARRLDRPIFLSIGYATCHWCHVMAHESFEDGAVAEHLNATFVPVKVDREERPDVDAIYMEACQLMTGHGGWPLTVLLTPEGKPFYTATYLPPRARYGRSGVVELCAAVAEAWQQRRAELLDAGQRLTEALQARWEPSEADLPAPGPEVLNRAEAQLRQRFDPEWGGWGNAPKFPTPHVGRLLLRRAAREPGSDALEMVVHTLDAMRRGGIYDHLGGGFHRYSTDREWKLPHFEKMLYDQAGLLLLYAEAYAATGAERFARTAREIVAYLVRDLQDEGGAFYAAEDADSEGREGAFYVWHRAELDNVLGPEAAGRFAEHYEVSTEGNFAEEATGKRTGENVLWLPPARDLDATATDVGFEAMRDALFRHRMARPRPLLDDKILADWNGLAIASLARSGVLLGEARFVALAESAMRFVLDKMRAPDGRLLHRARGGTAGLDALADDYAFGIWGLLELHQATQHIEWLGEAVRLQEDFDARFWDASIGAYRLQPTDGEKLIARTVAYYDGASPSANSVAAHNLLRLSRLTGRVEWAEQARRIFTAASADLHAYPAGQAHLLLALDEDVHAPPDVVITVPQAETATPFVEVFHRQMVPGSLIAVLDPAARAEASAFAPHLTAFEGPAEGVRAFVCQNLYCEAPVQTPAALAERLA